MNGYGSHTFKLVNEQGKAVYVKVSDSNRLQILGLKTKGLLAPKNHRTTRRLALLK